MEKKNTINLQSLAYDILSRERMKIIIGGEIQKPSSEHCSKCVLYNRTGSIIDTLNVAPGTPMAQCNSVAGSICYADPECHTYYCS